MGIAIPQVITPDRATGAQVIDGSLKFDDDNKNYLERTPGSAGNRQTFTWSGWIKRNSTGAYQVLFGSRSGADDFHHVRFRNNETLETRLQVSNTDELQLITNQVFRELSGGWYHIVFAFDSTESTNSDKAKLYVNGSQITSFSTETYPSGAPSSFFSSTTTQSIGRRGDDNFYHNGSMSQVYFIDGEALGPESFGFTDPLTNTWKPKKYTGAFTRSSFNDGTNWTSSLSATSGTLSNGANAFDGDLSTRAQTVNPATGKELTFAPPAINFTTSLEVYCDQGNSTPTATWNGNTVNPGGGAWVTVYSGSGELSSTYPLVINTETATQYATLKGVRIDGEILIDNLNGSGVNSFYLPMDGNSPIGQDQSGNGNNFTPVNFGGSVELDKATGAKPILNTVGGATATIGVFGSRQNVGYAVTVYNSGGGNKYYLDGVEAPTLTGLIRGATYTFDQTDNSNSTHPLVLATTAEGNNYGIGVSITGSPGSTGITSITIPHNAPDTLYYHCSNHSGMGGSITGITTNEKLADLYASNCVLALPLIGIATDVSTSIACTSHRKNVTASVVGVATTANFYSNSMRWSATTSSLAASEQGDELIFGTGDFTIECWVRDDNGHDGNSNRCYIFDNRSGGSVAGDPPILAAYVDNHSEWNVYIGNPVVEIVVDVGTSGIIDQWNHFAVTREGSTVRMFVNGVELGSATSSTNFTNNGIGIGRGYDSGYGWAGQIQDFRVYKGVAKYTKNFSPASPNPDILPDTPSGVSGSSKLTKITDGSVSFTGIGGTDLSVADSADFTMGSGEWTMECFAYLQTPESGQYESLVQKYATSNSDSSWFWSVYTYTTGYGTQNFYFYDDGATSHSFTGATTKIALNQWHHLAVVRDSNTIRTYINGVQDGTISLGGSITMNDTTCDLTIGADSANNYAMAGMISNARVIKGTCLYPDGKSFTPPGAPLTNVTNTKLLCCQSPTSATEAAVAPPNEPFSGAGGAQGRGTTSDYLQVSSSGHSDFSLDGDFTVEWWHYRAVTSVNNGFMWTIGDSNTSTGLELYWGTSGTQLNLFTNGGSNITSATAATGWHHYAVVRSGSTITVYYDGTSVDTLSSSTTFSGNVTIGGEYYGGNITGGMHGPMSQFRLVKGTAVYTSNFTAPTTALTAITNTKILTLQGDTITDASGTSKVIQVFGNVNTDNITARGDVEGSTFNPFNTDINTVRGQETGYATLNPLTPDNEAILSDGNLETTFTTDSSTGTVPGTIFVDSGKWYCEVIVEEIGALAEAQFGIMREDDKTNRYIGATGTNGYGWEPYQDRRYGPDAANTKPFFGTTYTSGTHHFEMALDLDEGTLDIYNDGALLGELQSGIPSGRYTFAVADIGGSDYPVIKVNFGQKPFKFPPPDGFQALNASNVRPETVISRPDQYVGIVTYTGNNTVGRKIDIGKNADLIWVKKFAPDGENHILVDTVRGANNFLIPDDTAGINTSGGPVTGLGSTVFNGFIVDNNGYVNANSSHYICWNWKAGGDKGTFNIDNVGYASAAAAGLDGGVVTPSGASVGTKQGFSILKYSGTAGESCSHGLTQAPEFIIEKELGNSTAWTVQTTVIDGSLDYLYLNTNAQANDYNVDAPTSTVFDIGRNDECIAYLWHSVPGLQKFGMYKNNTSTDGPFVELGFKPALFVIKRTDTTGNWWVFSAERNPVNLSTSNVIRWDQNNAETAAAASYAVDFLSNGFKIRSQTADLNYDTGTAARYIYCAWAEAPSIDLYGGGANAR